MKKDRIFDPTFEKLLTDVEKGISDPQEFITYLDKNPMPSHEQYVRSLKIAGNIGEKRMDKML